MMPAQTIAAALAGCAEHRSVYGVEVSARVLSYWQTGEALRYHAKCLPETLRLPQLERGTVRLALVPPSWAALSELGGLDDALSGPLGEWTHAKRFLPLFLADQSSVVVAQLDDPLCPVGWYEDGTALRGDADGYAQGVFRLAPSLEAFLRMLVDVEAGAATFETELEHDYWEALAPALPSP
jgi:hypothetical protein